VALHDDGSISRQSGARFLPYARNITGMDLQGVVTLLGRYG
jgi:hypothetical protein